MRRRWRERLEGHSGSSDVTTPPVVSVNNVKSEEV